jgi:hypothetical protein
MPYQNTQVPADMFMRHNGVGIYHVYKNDDIEDVIRTYWFVTDPYQGEDKAFDVRDADIAPDVTLDKIRGTDAWIKLVLTAAIDQERITKDGAIWMTY